MAALGGQVRGPRRAVTVGVAWLLVGGGVMTASDGPVAAQPGGQPAPEGSEEPPTGEVVEPEPIPWEDSTSASLEVPEREGMAPLAGHRRELGDQGLRVRILDVQGHGGIVPPRIKVLPQDRDTDGRIGAKTAQFRRSVECLCVVDALHVCALRRGGAEGGGSTNQPRSPNHLSG